MVRRSPAATVLVALLVLAACGDDPTAPEPVGFELELVNFIFQTGGESSFTPRLTVVAATAEARFRAPDVTGITVTWPDGTTSSVAPEFLESGGRTIATGLDPLNARALPSGVYEVTLQLDGGDRIELESEQEIEVLPPAEDLELDVFDDRGTLRWTAPPSPHTWRIVLSRVIEQPGPDGSEIVLVLPEESASGGEPIEATFPLEQIEPGAPFRVDLTLTDPQNVRAVDGTAFRPGLSPA